MADWRLTEAENEMRSRDRNERINETVTDDGERVWFVCECGDANCSTGIQLTHPEYEDVRGHPNQFALATHHENPQIELILVEYDRYTTTTKTYPPARALAYDTNPRSRPDPRRPPHPEG